LATAAAVAAVIGSMVTLTAAPNASRPDRVVVVTAATGDGPDGGVAALVVRDGDEVEASGLVLAAPGKPVRFCAPALEFAFDFGAETPSRCSHGVDVFGVDLDALAEPGTTGAVRHGRAYLRGVWHGGTITVTAQGPPVPAPLPPPPPPLPCPAPDGGWTRGFLHSSNELQDYIGAHAERFRPLWVSYPLGPPAGSGSMAPDAIEVLVVEVVRGDATQASEELRRHYAGNLCVVARPDLPSLADRERLLRERLPALEALMEEPVNGIYQVAEGDVLTVSLVVITEPLLATFTAIGLDGLVFDPWLRHVQ
jgi:hypothetical protein